MLIAEERVCHGCESSPRSSLGSGPFQVFA